MTPADADRRAAAAILLGPRADAGREQARAAFFLRLVGYDFAPPEETVEAAAVLGVLPGGAESTPALDRYRRRRLEADVERFAGEYWTLPPAARKARWDELA